jgi:thiol-disulfide isomerase/thioredoxin
MNKLKYFTASWCGPCKVFKPVINDLKEEGYCIDVIDIDSNASLVSNYEVMSVPHLVFEKECEQDSPKSCTEIYARFSGATTKENIKSLLND